MKYYIILTKTTGHFTHQQQWFQNEHFLTEKLIAKSNAESPRNQIRLHLADLGTKKKKMLNDTWKHIQNNNINFAQLKTEVNGTHLHLNKYEGTCQAKVIYITISCTLKHMYDAKDNIWQAIVGWGYSY